MLRGKRILMTGITGQLGTALAKGLASENEIWGLARFSAPGARERAKALGLRPVLCDYTTNNFEGVPDDFDYVLHAAAAVAPESADEGIVQNAEGTGFLLNHVKSAKAFIYISTTAVYREQPDPKHLFVETDPLGGLSPHSPHYGLTKAAGEAVTRTLGQILGVPTTILRMSAAYGACGNGGLPGVQLGQLITDQSVYLPALWPSYHNPIHEDDLIAQIEGAFAAATLKSTILNWGGNEVVSMEDWVRYMAALIGVEPKFNRMREGALASYALDCSKRDRLIGRCKVHWKDGMRRMIQERYPDIKLKNIA